ncbi:hypothetical protein FNH05_15840, partial [Amycolatopsis rhizosphaerae]
MPAFRELLRPAEHRPRRSSALTTAVIALLLPTLAIGAYLAGASGPGITGLQLAGTGAPRPLPPGTAAAVWWHLVLVLGCGAGGLLGTTAAIWTAWTPRAQTVARFARFSALITLFAALAADVLTLVAVPNP